MLKKINSFVQQKTAFKCDLDDVSMIKLDAIKRLFEGMDDYSFSAWISRDNDNYLHASYLCYKSTTSFSCSIDKFPSNQYYVISVELQTCEENINDEIITYSGLLNLVQTLFSHSTYNTKEI